MALKAAAQKNEVFLADVTEIRRSGGAALWWLGQSGFLVLRHGRALIFDPYLSDSLTRKYAGTDKPHVRLTERVVDPRALGAALAGALEVVTSTHAHTDHLDGETLRPLLEANPAARLVVPAAIRELVLERIGSQLAARLVEMDAGTSATWGEIELHGIPAAHNEVEKDDVGRCKFLGYVVRWGGLTLYHSGDTLWHEGLVPALRPFQIDWALLPINGNRPERRVAGNLDGKEAATLAFQTHARLVIPCHYDLFEFNTVSPDEFEHECRKIGQPYQILPNGGKLMLSV